MFVTDGADGRGMGMLGASRLDGTAEELHPPPLVGYTLAFVLMRRLWGRPLSYY